MSKRYQKTIFLSKREESHLSPSPPTSPPPPPPPLSLPLTTINLNHYRSVETNSEVEGLKYDFRYKSEINRMAGKRVEKIIEIPVVKDIYPTKPPISSNTTVMSYKKRESDGKIWFLPKTLLGLTQERQSVDGDFWTSVKVGEGKTWFLPQTLLGQPFPTHEETQPQYQTPKRQVDSTRSYSSEKSTQTILGMDETGYMSGSDSTQSPTVLDQRVADISGPTVQLSPQERQSVDGDFWTSVEVGEGKTWFLPQTLLGQPFPTPVTSVVSSPQTGINRRIVKDSSREALTSESTDTQSLEIDRNFWSELRISNEKTWFLPQTLLGQPFPTPAPTLGDQQTRVTQRTDNMNIDRDFWTEHRVSDGKTWFFPETLLGQPFPTAAQTFVGQQTPVRQRAENIVRSSVPDAHHIGCQFTTNSNSER
ncbi:unnamed protein product [Medioppia subpectinata]|uniref:Uncharacterized protein n=1 Tax=Medioppia subpectinata TaxID=1979941 RepID=A0A7R9Q6N8_9ACAR|nr:unnamed protein product [Medioppia subpectinata]CAG2114771.1 unnamed protein product [Medioppia subpectinata]